MNPGHPSVLFAEVVTQMGIEPVTTRCLVVVLTTKLLGRLGSLAHEVHFGHISQVMPAKQPHHLQV